MSRELIDAISNNNNVESKMDSKPSDFLNTFEKTIKDISKKYRVSDKELMSYFEKEMLSI
jgi:hypothetical protein